VSGCESTRNRFGMVKILWSVPSESGCVTSGSFLDWVGVQQSTFNKTIFQLISRRCFAVKPPLFLLSNAVLGRLGITVIAHFPLTENLTLSGKLRQFDDFLVAMITFCLFTQSDLLRFLFNSIDADESGSVSEEEYRALLEMMTTGEGNSFPGSFKRMLEVVDVNKDGAIQFDEFLALAQRFPLAMFPLFQFQIQVHAATLGQEGWMKVKRRVDLMLEAAAMTVPSGKT
jgi:hypothetical protein